MSSKPAPLDKDDMVGFIWVGDKVLETQQLTTGAQFIS